MFFKFLKKKKLLPRTKNEKKAGKGEREHETT
jgi:hypothetical protein